MKNFIAAALIAAGVLFGAGTANAESRRDVTIHNQSGAQIINMWTKVNGAGTWNLVNGGGVSSGYYTGLGFAGNGPCRIDFMIQTADGEKSYWTNWNFCALSDIYFTFNENTGKYRATGE